MSTNRAISGGLAFSAYTAQGTPSAYNSPSPALYLLTSEVGPEFVWSVESMGCISKVFVLRILRWTQAEIRGR